MGYRTLVKKACYNGNTVEIDNEINMEYEDKYNTAVLCGSCGIDMKVGQIMFYKDSKNGNHFFDVMWNCKQCGKILVSRYGNEHFLNCTEYKSCDDYKPDMQQRELLYHIWRE